LARIAESVEENGTPWGAIIGVIAVSGGFAYLLCKGIKYLDLVQELGEFIATVVDIAAVVAAIQVALAILRKATGIVFARKAVIVLIAVLVATLAFLRLLLRHQQAVTDAAVVTGLRSLLEEACEAANTRIGQLISQGKRAKVSIEDLSIFNQSQDLPDAE
jgi:amino acid transporter